MRGHGVCKNRASMEERGVRLISPPQKAMGKDGRFSVEDFVYDEANDLFVCPAGKRLRYIGDSVEVRKRRRFAALRSACRVCDWKLCCTKYSRREIKVSASHASLVRLRADSHTEDFKQIYAGRAPTIEGVFAEAKQRHGLGRAWRRGLMKMRVQCFLIASVMNYKRLAALYWLVLHLKRGNNVLLRVIRRILSELTKIERQIPFTHRSQLAALVNRG